MVITIEVAHKGEDYYGVNFSKGKGPARFETNNYREVSLQAGETIKLLLKALEVQASSSDNTFSNV